MTLDIDHNTTLLPALPNRMRRRSPLRNVGATVLGALVIAHGAVHLLGAAKGLGWAQVSALAQPVSAAMSVGWLVAAVVTMAAGVLIIASVRWWWIVGAAAGVLSQVVIILDWTDAAFGTVVNVLLAAAVIYAYAAHGPNSFESRYRRSVVRALHALGQVPGTTPRPLPALVTERDMESLPVPVARYVRQSGAVGRPQVDSFRALFHGRIRAGADRPWMKFTGEQVNTFGRMPERFFKMDATLAHLPVDVLHVFTGDEATMRVKLCSLVPMVNSSGSDLTRAETVTLLNDMCVLAPAALTTAAIEWTGVNDHQVSATFTRGTHTVTADLVFNEHGQLADFTSDDRFAVSVDGKTSRQQRWSTPLNQYRSFHGRTISASAYACWHAPEGLFRYLEFEVDEITYQADSARRNSGASRAPSADDGLLGAPPVLEATRPSPSGSQS